MTAQLITPNPPAPIAPGPVRHRHVRNASVVAAVVALVATGGYVVTTTIGPDAAPPTRATGADVVQSAQAMRDLRASVAGQYGSRLASGATVTPSARVTGELRDSVAGQYGSQLASGATVTWSARVTRELRNSVAGQYGNPALNASR